LASKKASATSGWSRHTEQSYSTSPIKLSVVAYRISYSNSEGKSATFTNSCELPQKGRYRNQSVGKIEADFINNRNDFKIKDYLILLEAINP
jgi:hypothetical protein